MFMVYLMAAQPGLRLTRLRREGRRREILKFSRVEAAVKAKTPCN